MTTLLTKEIREEIYQPVKSIKNAIGRELKLILDRDVGDAQSLIDTFNIIKKADRNTLDSVFGGPKKKDKGGYSSFKTDLFSRLIRMALFNLETSDYLTTLKAVCSTDDKDEKNLITYGKEGLLDSKRVAAYQPLTNIEEIRESLLASVSSFTGTRGEECRKIIDAPIHNEEEFIKAFNHIHCSILEDLTEEFNITSSHGSFKNRMKETLIKIALFNTEATDYVEQLKLCYAFPKKTENYEYFKLVYGEEHAKEKLRVKGDRVRGENNPGYQHGGKFSPFSKKFVGYSHLTEEEKEYKVENLFERVSDFKKENPHLENTKIEYYLAQGMSEEEATSALSERQATFTLEKCVEKHGEVEGIRIWLDRQLRWQDALNNLPQEDRFAIIRKKSRGAWKLLSNYHTVGYVYLMGKGDNYKFGITSNLESRLKTVRHESCIDMEFIAHAEMPINQVIEVEDALCEFFKEKTLFNNDEVMSNSVEYFIDERPTEEVLTDWRSVVNTF